MIDDDPHQFNKQFNLNLELWIESMINDHPHQFNKQFNNKYNTHPNPSQNQNLILSFMSIFRVVYERVQT